MDCTAMVLTTSENSQGKTTITYHRETTFFTYHSTGTNVIHSGKISNWRHVGYQVGPPKSRSFTTSSWTNSSSAPGDMEPRKTFRTYWSKWQDFTCEQSVNPFHLPVNKVLDFLLKLYEQDLGDSGINTARCALSLLITLEGSMKIGKHLLIHRFIKGVF